MLKKEQKTKKKKLHSYQPPQITDPTSKTSAPLSLFIHTEERVLLRRIQTHRGPANRTGGNLNQPRVQTPPVKDVIAGDELSAPLAFPVLIQANDAIVVRSAFDPLGVSKLGKLEEILGGQPIRGTGELGPQAAAAVEGTAGETEEEDGGDAEEEEEEGGYEGHDEGLEDEGEHLLVGLWRRRLNAMVVVGLRRHGTEVGAGHGW